MSFFIEEKTANDARKGKNSISKMKQASFDWNHFNSPKPLTKSIASEADEFLECFFSRTLTTNTTNWRILSTTVSCWLSSWALLNINITIKSTKTAKKAH